MDIPQQVVAELEAQGYNASQIAAAWAAMPPEDQHTDQAFQLTHPGYLATQVQNQIDLMSSGARSAGQGNALSDMLGQGLAKAKPSGPQAGVSWQAVTGMSSDDMGQWLSGSAPINFVLQQPMPSTTRSTYSMPKGVPGAKLPTVQDQMVSLTRLSRDDLSRLQQKLVEGGYYPSDAQTGTSRPQWGVLDKQTQEAFFNLIRDSVFHPGQGIDDLIANASQRNLPDLGTARKQKVNDAVAKALASNNISNQSQLTATKDLEDAMIQRMQNAIGRRLTPEEMQAFVDSSHAEQKANQQNVYDAIVAKATAAAQGVSEHTVDQFLNAVQKGDGSGTFVHAPGTNELGMTASQWSTWASKAGLPANAPQTAENQKLVGREIVYDLYDRYNGNWQDIATAWFAGPGGSSAWAPLAPGTAPSSTLTGGLSQFDTSIDGRVDVVTRAMRVGADAQNAALASGAAGSTNPLTFNEADASPGAQADLWLQSQHPTEYVGHAAGENAATFLDMLSHPTVNVPAHN